MKHLTSLRDRSLAPMPRSTMAAANDVEQRIDALAASFADRIGDRALDVVIHQFDEAEGDIKLVWGRIMEWLILHREERSALLAR